MGRKSLSETEIIHFDENEYRTLETIAKELGLEKVDDLVTVAMINLAAWLGGVEIEPRNSKRIFDVWQEAQKKPGFNLKGFIKDLETRPGPPEIETEKITLQIPKKLLALVKERRNKDWKEYLQNCLTDTVAADIDAGAFGYHQDIIEEFGLKGEMEAYKGH